MEDPAPAVTEALTDVLTFLESFNLTVCENLPYKDTSIATHSPHSFYARLNTTSDKAWIFADLEKRRKSAIDTIRAALSAREGEKI